MVSGRRPVSREERLAYAKKPIPAISPTEVNIALQILSNDRDPEIRKAVIQNPWADPIVLLHMMEHEKDPDVLAALDAFRQQPHRIMPEEERPLPEGW